MIFTQIRRESDNINLKTELIHSIRGSRYSLHHFHFTALKKKKTWHFTVFAFFPFIHGLNFEKPFFSQYETWGHLKEANFASWTSTCSLKGNGLPNWCPYVFVESTWHSLSLESLGFTRKCHVPPLMNFESPVCPTFHSVLYHFGDSKNYKLWKIDISSK